MNPTWRIKTVAVLLAMSGAYIVIDLFFFVLPKQLPGFSFAPVTLMIAALAFVFAYFIWKLNRTVYTILVIILAWNILNIALVIPDIRLSFSSQIIYQFLITIVVLTFLLWDRRIFFPKSQ